MDSLFAYGTLQFPHILLPILGRQPESIPATLPGYARYLIRNEDYPGIVPLAGARTEGTLFTEIREEEWRRLDKYESDLYVRQVVHVYSASGESLPAYAYVIPESHRHHLTDLPWEPPSYRPRRLPGRG